MDLNELASFVRVVRHGTITAAADEEGVPKSTISRRIGRLEHALGVSLLHRSARSFTVTDDGRLLYERAVGALRELQAVENALIERGEVPAGTLVIAAPTDMGRTPLMSDLVAAYRQKCPRVEVDLRLEQRVVDLVEEGVDVALRPHGAVIPGSGDLMSRRIGTMRARIFASPQFIATHGQPQQIEDVYDLPSVVHGGVMRRLEQTGEVPLEFGRPVVRVNDFLMICALVERGVGMGVIPVEIAKERVESGRLRCLVPAWDSYHGHVSLLWPASRHLAPRVRAFVDLAAQTFEGRADVLVGD